MDIRLSAKNKPALRLFKPFEYSDLFPYCLSFLILTGSIYLFVLFMRCVSFSK